MGREGAKTPDRDPSFGQYPVRKAISGGTYNVTVASRTFLVIVAFSRTIVFERIAKPDCYVMRREVLYEMDPVGAVSGYTLGTGLGFDPVTELQAKLDARDRAYWAGQKEIQRLREALQRREKRGKRVRRNS